MNNNSEKKSYWIFSIYLISFLFTLHGTLPVYVNSSFLSKFSTEKFVGIIYTIASAATIFGFLAIPKILRKYGNYATVMALIIVEFLSLMGLAFLKSPIALTAFFITSFMSTAIFALIMDLFLESVSTDNKTGKIRGTYLTIGNFAWIIGPAITSLVLTDGNYWKIYAGAAILLLPILFIMNRDKINIKNNSSYREIPFKGTLKEIWFNKDLKNIFIIGFFMQFFFAWMIIYMPIYLHEHIGFGWKEIGIIFSIMLFPYVLTELPLGKLADAKWGEKEILVLGFIIMALSTGILSFIISANFILWAAVLFITRIGASMTEIMSETYFFKKVDSSSANIVSLFRTIKPVAYIISPLVAIILLYAIDLKFLFLFLGLLMLFGLRFILLLQDTR